MGLSAKVNGARQIFANFAVGRLLSIIVLKTIVATASVRATNRSCRSTHVDAK